MFHEFMQMGGGAAWAIAAGFVSLAAVYVVARIFNFFEASERRSDDYKKMQFSSEAKQIEHKAASARARDTGC